MVENLGQLVELELKRRGNKTVEKVYWSCDSTGLSVWPAAGTPENPMSFNYAPDADLSIEEIADYIEERCKDL